MSERKSSNTVKKAYKKNPKAFIISAIAIVLVIAITVTVIYFAFPDTWDSIMVAIGVKEYNIQDDNGGNNTSNGGSSNGGGNSNNNTTPPTLIDGELQIHFIDVGQGDCILILFPDGKDMLIDCGNANASSSSNALWTSTITYINTYVTDGQLDYFMITHSDKDHVSFADDILGAFDVDVIYMPFILAKPSNASKANAVNNLDKSKLDLFTDDDTADSGVYADFFISALSEPEAEIVLNIGQYSIETEFYTLDFYCFAEADWEENTLKNAEEINAVSPIGILEYNGKRIVLTGDSNEINEPKFIEQVGGTIYDCDVLKVGHHGSATSSTREFLDFINCEYAVISCNASGNTFNHPRQATLDRLRADEMELYRTDLHGTIVLVVDSNGTITFTTAKTTTEDIWVGADSK